MKMDKDFYKQIGFLLRLARQNKKMSLAEAGEIVNKSKVSIKRYEDGDSRIDTPTFENLCRAYGINPKDTLLEARNNADLISFQRSTAAHIRAHNQIFLQNEVNEDAVHIKEPDRRFEVLTDDENELIDVYRKMSEDSKNTLLALAKNMK